MMVKNIMMIKMMMIMMIDTIKLVFIANYRSVTLRCTQQVPANN